MPYNATIEAEQVYVSRLGVDAVEAKFYGLYNTILSHWFTSGDGYIVEAQVQGPGRTPYFVVRHTNSSRDPTMVVRIERPNTLHTGGKAAAFEDIKWYMHRRFQETGLDVMYGLAGVGLWWSVWKMERGSATVTNIQQWRGSVASDTSYGRFQRVFKIIEEST